MFDNGSDPTRIVLCSRCPSEFPQRVSHNKALIFMGINPLGHLLERIIQII